ncbi:MAG TPA: hypothetical protein VJS69_01185 [Candidatus Krumholzibacteria bacterium]|nr:hypothetical protein [Candidatus Krumholzibacteria bacterium]
MRPATQNRHEQVDCGARVSVIREALALTGTEFAALVQPKLFTKFDKSKLSRLETGKRALNAREAFVIADLDPEQRGVRWLVLGEKEKRR